MAQAVTVDTPFFGFSVGNYGPDYGVYYDTGPVGAYAYAPRWQGRVYAYDDYNTGFYRRGWIAQDRYQEQTGINNN